MKLSSPNLKIFSRSGPKKRLASKREDVIVWGVEALALILVLILAFDALLFYRILRPPEIQIESPAVAAPEIRSEELDEVIRLLDDREQKFRELLAK